MIKNKFVEEIIGKFSEFDGLKTEYNNTFKEEHLHECTSVLLQIDALISNAEFEEITDISKKEIYIVHLSKAVGFKETIWSEPLF